MPPPETAPRTVADIMTRELVSVALGTRVETAMHLMRDRGISSVLVEPGADGQWGILTYRDVLSRIVHANRSPAMVDVENLATKPLLTMAPDTTLRACAKMMMDATVRRIVVADGDTPIGIVSDTDIFRVVDEYGWEESE